MSSLQLLLVLGTALINMRLAEPCWLPRVRLLLVDTPVSPNSVPGLPAGAALPF